MYVGAQMTGAFTGAAIAYANYFKAIDLFEGGSGIRTVKGTAGVFSTYAIPYMSDISCFWDEVSVSGLESEDKRRITDSNFH